MRLRIWALVVLVLFVVGFLPGPVAASGGGLPPDLEPLLDRFFAEKMAEHDVPGAVFTLVRDGQIYSKGYGMANLERQIPVDPEQTLFRIASVTKVFAAVAILQLVEEGKVNLEANVNHYLQGFQVQNSFERPLRVADLLLHTDGFEERNLDVLSLDPAALPPLQELLADQLPPVVVEPGTQITYGSWSGAVASAIVQQVSGMGFEQYVAERIFRPLGMSLTTLEQARAVDRAATVYRDGKPSPFIAVTTSATGGGSATGPEMGRFLLALLEGGGPILRDASVKQMFTRQFGAHPDLAGVTYGFFEHLENGQRGLLREGSGVGVNSRIFLLPQSNTAFFVAYNTRGGELSAALTSTLLEHWFPGGARAPAPVGGDVAKFAGQYRYVQYSRYTLGKVGSLINGLLSVKAEGEGVISVAPTGMGDPYGGFEDTARWVQVGPTLFQREDGRGYLAFGLDGAGRPAYLYSGQGYHSAYERLAWYMTPGFHLGLAGVFALLFVGGLVLAFTRGSGLGRAFRLLAGASSALSLLLLIGALPVAFAVGTVGGFPSLAFYGDKPWSVDLVLTLPWVVLGLSLCLAVGAAAAWRKGWGHPVGRWAYTVLSLSTFGLVGYMAYWRLIF